MFSLPPSSRLGALASLCLSASLVCGHAAAASRGNLVDKQVAQIQKAVTAYQSGEYEKTRTLLLPLVDKDQLKGYRSRDYLLFLLGESEALIATETGNVALCGPATTHLRAVEAVPDTPLSGQARARAADCLRLLGKTSDAEAAYRSVLGSSKNTIDLGTARFRQAELLGGQSDEKKGQEARTLLRRIYIEQPMHPLAESALAKLRSLDKDAQLDAQEHLERAKNLLSGRRWIEAAAELQGLPPDLGPTLRDEVDVSRGDILVDAASPPGVTDQFQATVVWMHETELLPGRPYLIKLGTSFATATVSALKYKVNVNTLEKLAARTLSQSEIGVCNLSLDRALAFDSYADNRDTGGFILIDRMTNNTVGAGLIHFALRRADNIHWQAIDLNKEARALQKGQKPCVLWFTGLSGSGKSTIANLVDKQLYAQGRHSYILDGDNVRHGLCKDLGFSPSDRVENIRRVAEVAKLMVDSGLIVLVAFISPFRAERQLARSLFAEGEFLEIFVDTPLAEAERRDPKGLYKKARAQQLKNFTGIDSPYEAPESPEIRIDTTTVSAEDAAAQIVYRLG